MSNNLFLNGFLLGVFVTFILDVLIETYLSRKTNKKARLQLAEVELRLAEEKRKLAAMQAPATREPLPEWGYLYKSEEQEGQ